MPRNLHNKREREWAGWKNLLLQVGAPHYYARGFWIDPDLGRMFQEVHKLYVRYHRAVVPDVCPYYFVSLHGSSLGQPWTVKAFQKAWRTAVERVTGTRQAMSAGTNPHAGRHRYGQRAADMGIDPRVRQIMMHHRSLHSQFVYQVPSPEQVDRAIGDAQSRALLGAREATRREEDGEMCSQVDETILEALLSPPASAAPSIDHGHLGYRTMSDPLAIMASWKLYRGLKW